MFQVGDKVTTIQQGKGVISSIKTRTDFPILVKATDKDKADELYMIDGRYLETDTYPSMILGHYNHLEVKGVNKPKNK